MFGAAVYQELRQIDAPVEFLTSMVAEPEKCRMIGTAVERSGSSPSCVNRTDELGPFRRMSNVALAFLPCRDRSY